MKLSHRELFMTAATLVVVLGGASVWMGDPLRQKWGDADKARVRLQDERKESEHVIAQRKEWDERLKSLRAKMPQHNETEQVTAEILKTIKQLADANRVNISRMQPDAEKDLGDGLREVAIECTWDTDLDGLVHFLYAVQVQGAILDIRQMTVQPAQGMAGRLKGNFTVFNAFSRAKPKAEPPPGPGAAAPPAGPVSAKPR